MGCELRQFLSPKGDMAGQGLCSAHAPHQFLRALRQGHRWSMTSVSSLSWDALGEAVGSSSCEEFHRQAYLNVTEKDVHEVTAHLLCNLGDYLALLTNQDPHMRLFRHQKFL